MRTVLIVCATLSVCILAAAAPHEENAEDERHNMRQSREHLVQYHEYEHAKRQAKDRRREHIAAAKHQRSPWLASNVQCLLRNGTSDEEAQKLLTWLCDARGGAHTCHGIQEGGSHYNPVAPKEHLEWAMTSLHETREDTRGHGHSTCWFGDIAYLVPAPVNEFFLELPQNSTSGRSSSNNNGGRLVKSGGEDLLRSSDVMVLGAGKSIFFESTRLIAFADKKRKHATFEIHVQGGQPGALLLAELAFDFDGNGEYDRVETFHTHAVRTNLNGTAYTWKARGQVRGDASFRNLETGSVRLQLSNVGTEDCELWRFAEASPSHVRIPYFPY